MGATAGIISGIISLVGTGVKLLGSSGGPNYPSPPKLYKLPVQEAKAHLEDYEKNRMAASIDAWKAKFPDLYKGGQYEIDDIKNQQQGYLGGNIAADTAASGLGPVKEGVNQYALSRDIGLSPITLSQRTSQAVTRQIAQNPEWTNQITGGTLATMLANNAQNATAYGMMQNANKTAQYVAGQQAGMYNTQALLSGLTGAARIGATAYGANQYGALSPAGQGIYQAQDNASQAPPASYQPQAQYQPPQYGSSYMWNAGAPSTMGAPSASNMYSNSFAPINYSSSFTPAPDYSLYSNDYSTTLPSNPWGP